MASNMKERNDKKAWAAYEKDFKKLKAEVLKRRSAIFEKYKAVLHPSGLDTSPEDKELGEVNKWFSQELKTLRKRHGIR